MSQKFSSGDFRPKQTHAKPHRRDRIVCVKRRQFLSSGLMALPAIRTATPALTAAQTRRPNIVILLADDLGTSDLKHRGGEIDTPHLDRLAQQGTIFHQAYVCAVCSPMRSGLMTGRSPMRLGVTYGVIRPWLDFGVSLEEHFMPQTFQAAGYQTAITGKWHLGHHHKEYWPHHRGFDFAYGHVNGAIDYFTHERDGGLDWHRNGVPLREEGYSTDLIAKTASQWIRSRDKARPFFLYVPFNAPHAPLQAPEETLRKYAHIADPGRRKFAAMVDRMDTGVGRILAALDDEKIAGETIVLFLSDNGGPLAHGATNKGRRDGKASVYEGGLLSPAILRYPGHIAAGASTRQVFTMMDIFPTLAAAAGVEPRNRLPLDGRNMWSNLVRQRVTPREDLFFAMETSRGLEHAVRRGEWKLIRVVAQDGAARNELYRLDDDPMERRDLAAEQPKLVAELAAKVDEWRKLFPAGGVRLQSPQRPGWKTPAEWTEFAR